MSTTIETWPVLLPSGRRVIIRRLGAIEYEDALAAAEAPDGRRSGARLAAAYAFFAIVDGIELDDVAHAGRGDVMSIDDLYHLMPRIAYRSDLGDDPDRAEDAPAWDEKIVDEPKEVGEDPLVDEFPASEYLEGAAVGDDVAVVRDVPVLAGSGGVAAADAGDAAVHGGEVDRADEAGVAADG